MKATSKGCVSGLSGLEELAFPQPGNCFGCSPNNSAGLGLRFFRQGSAIVSSYVFDDRFQGAPGIVHGGLQAVVLDEAMCAAVFFNRGTYVLTAELNIKYHTPCRTGVPVRVKGEIAREEARFAVVRGEILGQEGDLLSSASGRFFYDRSRGRGKE